MQVAIVIPAAGGSTRFAQAAAGAGRSKLDEDLGGRPVLHRTVELFANYDHPDLRLGPIVVAGPADSEAFDAFRSRHADKLAILGVTLCRGGASHRYETVREALAHVGDGATHVAVHDAARPCAARELLDRVFETAKRYPAVAPAVPVGDTLKRAAPEPIADDAPDPLAAILGVAGRGPDLFAVECTVPRAQLHAAQTPQVFEASLLRRAYAQPDLASTDDAELIERLGERVVLVPGDVTNLKITVPADLTLARAILGVRGPGERASHKKF